MCIVRVVLQFETLCILAVINLSYYKRTQFVPFSVTGYRIHLSNNLAVLKALQVLYHLRYLYSEIAIRIME
jgi:hypothetical protein